MILTGSISMLAEPMGCWNGEQRCVEVKLPDVFCVECHDQAQPGEPAKMKHLQPHLAAHTHTHQCMGKTVEAIR